MKTKFILITLFIGAIIPIFANKQPKVKGMQPNFVYIKESCITYNNITQKVDAFWISKFEVSNQEYKLFLDEMKKENKMDSNIVIVKSDKWLKQKNKNDYKELYFRHPAFARYPVVNISYEAAMLYCQWLTAKLDDQQYEYRLPTKLQFYCAAKGGYEESTYPWSGPFLINSKGLLQCNYRRYGDEAIHKDENGKYVLAKSDYNYIDVENGSPGPVTDFFPNAFGLYNMSGNVAEMILQAGIAMGGSWDDTGYDVRIKSEQQYTEPSPKIGFRLVLVKK